MSDTPRKQKKKRRAITHTDLATMWDDLVGQSGHTMAHAEFGPVGMLAAEVNLVTGWQLDESFVFAINGEEVRHIYNEHHHERRAGQLPIEKEDFLKLPEVLIQPDKIYIDQDEQYGLVLIMQRKFDEHLFAVLFNASARKSLQVKSMRKQ
jgi:hypothetical protein